MITRSIEEGLTRRQLVKATGCKPYFVDYCRSCGYLPILRDSAGPGAPVIYHPNAIKVINKRMARLSSNSPMDADEDGT